MQDLAQLFSSTDQTLYGRRNNLCHLLFILDDLFLMLARFDPHLRQVCLAENVIERGEIRSLERLPTIHRVEAVVFGDRYGFRLRGGWFRIGLPHLAI